MTATHYGLSKDYEVSCEELDFLVDNVLLEQDFLRKSNGRRFWWLHY